METSRLPVIIREIIIWTALSLLLILFNRVGSLNWVRAVGEPVVNSVSFVGDRIAWGVGAPIRWVDYCRVGMKRMADLEERLALLMVDRSSLIVDSGLDRVKVISNGEKLLVERIDGLKEGSVLVDGRGMVVGRIVVLGKYTAEAIRPMDAGSKIAVNVGNGASGVLLGMGGTAELNEVLQAEVINKGDRVVTSGIDDLFPPGLVVGQVVEVINKPAELTKKASVELMGKVEETLQIVD